MHIDYLCYAVRLLPVVFVKIYAKLISSLNSSLTLRHVGLHASSTSSTRP